MGLKFPRILNLCQSISAVLITNDILKITIMSNIIYFTKYSSSFNLDKLLKLTILAKLLIKEKVVPTNCHIGIFYGASSAIMPNFAFDSMDEFE